MPSGNVNTHSNRAAILLSAPSRMIDNGDVETRRRLLRPRDRETIALKALDASKWTPADEPAWRSLRDTEIASLRAIPNAGAGSSPGSCYPSGTGSRKTISGCAA